MVKDKTGGVRQSRLRLNSDEGLLGALMRGEVVLQVVSVPTSRAGDTATPPKAGKRGIKK